MTTTGAALRVLMIAVGLVLVTACTGGSTSGDGAGTAAPTSPGPSATELPRSPSPGAESSPTAPSDELTSVPPADAEPCPAAYDTAAYDTAAANTAAANTAAANTAAANTAAAQPWVPAPPGTQTDGRLAPDADPVEVVLCRYAAVTSGPATLDGAPVRISGDLQRVRTDLHVPAQVAGDRACTPEGPQVPYLARLTYADGDLWIASTDTANGCADTGNGVFVSGSSRGGQLAASYDAGAWVPAVGS